MGKIERLNPLNDFVFLKVMGEKGAEEQCLGFLNSVFRSKSLRPAKLVWNSAIDDAKLEGIEIGSGKVLNLMRQGYTAEQIERMISANI